ncbi:hypothetical protein N7494_006931 [Penicillium frequentans]|uniref:Uncharacterized protein n=1 Tax=Penicillium frequentans TaxID=3151616 RepID=A0AAD6CZW4_9EURO|nr:hypothetical protein N7494_006931 [Penicillium glabrum]
MSIGALELSFQRRNDACPLSTTNNGNPFLFAFAKANKNRNLTAGFILAIFSQAVTCIYGPKPHRDARQVPLTINGKLNR